ncbi:FimV/HubP family polar landmark protein [Lysobacter solisilvae (ex Woo and Kim 2020)]|uniref:LysM peptidoglycan-binding domain-containing protein n=1 Tax=Agrilutibacter terrestris TaxID=2865112 RepID=A0A7H0FWF9_9GAMM|nr:FimV/HubP family polar landmark protein [Lysobacter terrestris]QNP40375.1 LysM peptidoglycan-binding domain-containing protein [Lysobacter terrestris]
MKRIAGTVLALLAASASFSASALGLGQIEVKSKVGQPFVAEIPIVTGDPSELEQLQAGLASPETFARIGLRPPIGIIADLQFTQALDARGNPIIRVTSTQPVSEPLLTFLVEVDWGQGRLVREYSALVDAPRTVSAPLQPEIAAPTVAAPAVIERPVETAVAAETPATPAEAAAGDTAAAQATATPAPAAEATPQERTAIAPTEPPPQVATATPISRPALDGSDYEVRAGDTLSTIAARAGGAGSLDQTMVALLRANPEAFIDGNINRLKAGAVLRVPSGAAMTELDAQQASAIVHSQIQEWRAARRAAPQPADADVASVPKSAQGRSSSTASTQSSKRVADARLEIVPPGASDATKAGTQSGFSAGGEGAMLQQELTQTKETLAAREAETQELKTRVAELEKLQQQQQQLISMKDSELAAAQQRLADAQKQQPQASAMPWAIGIGGALVLGGLIAWFMRRRDAAKPSFRAPVAAATPSIADAFAPRADAEAAAAEDAPETAPAVVAAAPRAPEHRASEPRAPEPRTPEPRVEPQLRAVPAWHTGNAQRDLLDPATQAAHERLELARAYLDLGDLAGARQLLGEIVINGDHVARQQAQRMLRELE